MSSVKKLAEEVSVGMQEALPPLRETVLKKRSLAVAAMLEVRTPNTIKLAGRVPLETDRSDRREQGLRRLLKNPLVEGGQMMERLRGRYWRRRRRVGKRFCCQWLRPN